MEFRVVLQKLDFPVQIYGQSYKKDLTDLPSHKFYAEIFSYILLKQSNSFHFLGIYYHYYLRYVNPAAVKLANIFNKLYCSGFV